VTVIYICNVGSQDLYCDGQPLATPRPDGRIILEDFAIYRERLSLPAIEPGLGLVRDQRGRVDLALFYVTDQPQDVPAQRRNHDTVNLGHIIQRYLAEKPESRVKKVILRPIRNLSSADNDAAHDFYHQELVRLQTSFPHIRTCYVSVAAGIPSLNTALLFQAVRNFGERCFPLYVSTEGRPVSLDIGHTIVKDVLKNLVIERLKGRDFAQAATLLQELGADPALVGLARYAQHRLNLDFETAQEMLLERVITAAKGRTGEFCEELRDGLTGLIERRPEALIIELYYNARILYFNERYIDFLGLMFRFLEVVLSREIARIHGLPMPDSLEDKRQAFRTVIENNRRLQTFLAQTEVDKTLNWRNFFFLLAMLHYLIDDQGNKDEGGYPILGSEDLERYRRVYEIAARMCKLMNLYNKSIAAGGFEGVSRPVIMSTYTGDGAATGRNPSDDMSALMELLELNLYDDPYSLIATCIVTGLEEI
jgi:hypothetical protein